MLSGLLVERIIFIMMVFYVCIEVGDILRGAHEYICYTAIE